MRALLDWTVVVLPLLLGIIGILVSLKTPDVQTHSRWRWAMGLGGLTLSLLIGFQQHLARVDEQQAKIESNRERTALSENVKEMKAQMSDLRFYLVSVISHPVQAAVPERRRQNLRERALTLSGDSIMFLSERAVQSPYTDNDNWFKYDSETSALWFKQFGPRYVQVRKDLLAAGIKNDLVNSLTEDQLANSSGAIRAAMAKLGLVGEKLPLSN